MSKDAEKSGNGIKPNIDAKRAKDDKVDTLIDLSPLYDQFLSEEATARLGPLIN